MEPATGVINQATWLVIVTRSRGTTIGATEVMAAAVVEEEGAIMRTAPTMRRTTQEAQLGN